MIVLTFLCIKTEFTLSLKIYKLDWFAFTAIANETEMKKCKSILKDIDHSIKIKR